MARQEAAIFNVKTGYLSFTLNFDIGFRHCLDLSWTASGQIIAYLLQADDQLDKCRLSGVLQAKQFVSALAGMTGIMLFRKPDNYFFAIQPQAASHA
ncbi:MAG: hypothetical protein PHW13_08080 [Methylococcales bacterium]|nr:hypothetical protein [Methylococcales bacterium]